LEKLYSVHAGHHDVSENDVDTTLVEKCQSLLPVPGLNYLIAFQCANAQIADYRLIINDQEPLHGDILAHFRLCFLGDFEHQYPANFQAIMAYSFSRASDSFSG